MTFSHLLTRITPCFVLNEFTQHDFLPKLKVALFKDPDIFNAPMSLALKFSKKSILPSFVDHDHMYSILNKTQDTFNFLSGKMNGIEKKDQNSRCKQ